MRTNLWLRGALVTLGVMGAFGKPGPAMAAPPAAVSVAGDTAAQLAIIERAIDKGRTDLHVPGAALVIVKDDRVIYSKGFGLRDVENNLSVTPDTLFAIGSSTKAFTAMLAMMSVDDGKLALSDPPRKYLPYFKLRDPEADAKVTVADLLCHRSGLDRTDMFWYANKLNVEETIRMASRIKPTAKLGEKFQYQNVMYLVAGQCVSVAERASWRNLVASRIFRPLHMKQTNTTIDAMVRLKDHAYGYAYDPEKKAPKLLPYHDLPVIAPAGAINSSATEMAQWVRLMLGGGVFEGKRLVSEASFAELFKPRISAGGGADYGYGWFLRDWNGHRVVEHGGNIDGFNAQVALMPDQNLGIVLLTNISASPLGSIAMETVWKNLVGTPKAVGTAAIASTARVAPELEAGTYYLAEAKMNLIIEAKAGKLMLHSTSIPEKPLENVGGRRYRLAVPNIDVFVTFNSAKDAPKATDLLFEQPGAKFICKRASEAAPAAAYSAPLTVGELMDKAVETQGGEQALRRHKTMTLKLSEAAENQGLDLETTIYSRLPNNQAVVQTIFAGRKRIGSTHIYFDGKDGQSENSFNGASKLTGAALDDFAVAAAMFPELNWKSLFKSAAIIGKEKVGDEEAYAVELKPEKGHAVIDYVSTKTYRVVGRKSEPGSQIEVFSDFRTVDGVLIPFVRSGTAPGLGEIVSTVKEIKFDAKLPDSLFRPKPAAPFKP